MVLKLVKKVQKTRKNLKKIAKTVDEILRKRYNINNGYSAPKIDFSATCII